MPLVTDARQLVPSVVPYAGLVLMPLAKKPTLLPVVLAIVAHRNEQVDLLLEYFLLSVPMPVALP